MTPRYILEFHYSDQQMNELDDETEFFETEDDVYRRLFELYRKHKETAFGKPPKKLKHGEIVLTYSVDVPEEDRRFPEDDSWSVEVEFSVYNKLSKEDQAFNDALLSQEEDRMTEDMYGKGAKKENDTNQS